MSAHEWLTAQERDTVSAMGAAVLIALTVAGIVAGVYWARGIRDSVEPPHRRPAASQPREVTAISGVRQTPIEQADAALELARTRQQLSSYGWVDRQAGLVRIPIERGMELVLQRQQAAAPTPSPAPQGQGAPGRPGAERRR
jgi:hypothetical protein